MTSVPRFPDELEEQLLRFEEAWNERPAPPVAAFFPSQAGATFLLELLRIDIARRREQQVRIDVQSYLEAFPALRQDAASVDRLLKLVPAAASTHDKTPSTLLDGVDSRGADSTVTTIVPQEKPNGVVIRSEYDGLVHHAEGGLGEVLVARERQLNRRVAIKTLKRRWARSARARRDFLREAEVTGRLDHPGIVPVHSLGRTADGRPCYSMRFVEGETLAAALQRYHREFTAPPAQRAVAFRALLTRFISACNTVGYAHSQGVLHRDLKPHNIMIGPFGETVVVDWGLAKIVFPGDTPGVEPLDEVATQAGDVLGTPAYMSPEQAAGQLGRLSPASDVFGLGATLYAILTGEAPYQASTTQDALQLARAATYQLPQRRNPDAPRALCAVCNKAMASRPEDRYATPLELAADLERWLAGEAVTAHPEAWPARLRRGLRRRKTLVAVLAVLLLILPPAAAVAFWFVTQARAQAELDREKARIKETPAEQITDYLTRLFHSADPVNVDTNGFRLNGQRSEEELSRRLLQRGSELVREHLNDQPLVRARLLEAIGNAYRSLGAWGEAEAYLRDAHSLRRQALGEGHAETLSSLQSLARLAHDRGDYTTAERLYRDVLAGRIALFTDRHTAVAETKYFLGWLTFDRPLSNERPQFNKEKLLEAERLLRESLAIREGVEPLDHRALGYTLSALASVKLSLDDKAAALAYATRALELFRSSDQDTTLGSVVVELIRAEEHRKARRYEQAEKSYLSILSLARRHLGPDHPIVLMQMCNLIGLYGKMDQPTRAEQVARELNVLLRNKPQFRSQPVIIDGWIYITDKIRQRGEVAEARGFYEEALRYARERPEGNEANITKLQERLRELSAHTSGR